MSEAQWLRQLEEEIRKLKQPAAERALDIVGFRRCYQESGRPTGPAISRRGASRSCAVLGMACLWAAGSAASDVAIPTARNPFRGSERTSV